MLKIKWKCLTSAIPQNLPQVMETGMIVLCVKFFLDVFFSLTD